VSEVEQAFAGLRERFNKANVTAERTYCFSLGEDENWTVRLTKAACEVERGKDEKADCYCEGPAELFLDVWNGRRELGPMDFLAGRVKSNNPMLLKEFVKAFQKP
jgi:putative sterol carrier protein